MRVQYRPDLRTGTLTPRLKDLTKLTQTFLDSLSFRTTIFFSARKALLDQVTATQEYSCAEDRKIEQKIAVFVFDPQYLSVQCRQYKRQNGYAFYLAKLKGL